jgi:hypothetical protein
MYNKIYMLIAWVLAVAFTSQAQQQTAILLESSSVNGVQEMFSKQVSQRNLVDNHIYTCGSTLNNGGTYDIMLTKHDLSNNLVWSVTYTGSGNYNDYATDVNFDTQGNIIVVGTKQISALNYDAVTLKYNNSGTLLWQQAYNGAGNGPDGLGCIVTDASDNIYVSGSAFQSASQLSNMLLIKYNSTGSQQWANTWNNATYNLQDAGFRIILSGAYVYSYGGSQISANPIEWRMVNAQYYASNGNLYGASTSLGDDEVFAEVTDVILDNNLYTTVTGYVNVADQGKNLRVTKFNQSLQAIWTHTYNNASNNDDKGNSVELYQTNLYVGGYTTLANGKKDMYMAKLNYTTGAQLWQTTLDGAGEDDEVIDIHTDGTGQVYLCGNSYKLGNSDYFVAKLKAQDGSLLAKNRLNGADNEDDKVSNMVVASSGSIYVAGQTGFGNNSYKYTLSKWSEKTLYVPVPADDYSGSGGYTTNNKQLRNTDGTANQSVKFYNQSFRVGTYLDDSKITYLLAQSRDSSNQDTTFRVDMAFTKGSVGAKVYPFKERDEFMNFYLGHMPKASERTPISDMAIKQGAYTNTDIIFSNSPRGFRHWIVARTGAPTADFEMTFDGQSGLSIDGTGKLKIATTIGTIIYTKAKAYSMNNSTGALTLLSWQPSFVVSGNKVGFTSFGTWSGTLVLEFGEEPMMQGGGPPADPGNMDWSTYYGNNSFYNHSESYDMVVDGSGFVYWAGYSSSQLFPIALLAESIDPETFGGYDAAIVSFDAHSKRQWASLYGGNRTEKFYAASILSQQDNGLWVGGYTCSTDLSFYSDGDDFQSEHHPAQIVSQNNFPFPKEHDGFLARFDPINGTIAWSTCIGSDDHYESITDIVSTPQGVLVVGDIQGSIVSTNPTANDSIPIQLPIWDGGGNAFYDSISTGVQDMMILKFDLNNQIEWSTLFGNNAYDMVFEAVDMKTDNGLTFAVAGKTTSMVGSQNGNYADAYVQSGEGGVLLVFGADGELIWKTAVKGTSSAQTVAFRNDSNGGKIYLGTIAENMDGQLTCDPTELAANSMCICNNYGSPNYDTTGFLDAYIMEFSALTYKLNWSTFIGTNTDEKASLLTLEFNDQDGSPLDVYRFMDLDVDTRGNLFVSGMTAKFCQSCETFPLLPYSGYYNDGYFNEFPDSHGDTYIVGYTPNKTLFWSTLINSGVQDNESYYGDIASEWPNQIVAFGDQSLYLSATAHNWRWPYMCPNEVDPWCQNGQALFNSTTATKWVLSRFNISAPIVTSTEEIMPSLVDQIRVFPNPTNDMLNVIMPMLKNHFQVKIYNSLGELVLEKKFLNTSQFTIDVLNLSSGFYSLQIKTEDTEFSYNFIKND